MKLLPAPGHYDNSKALQDYDDAKALLKQQLIRTYKDNKEKANMTAALNRFLPRYLKNEKRWLADKWKKDLGCFMLMSGIPYRNNITDHAEKALCASCQKEEITIY